MPTNQNIQTNTEQVMKTKKLLLSLFGIVILNLFISSCKKDSNGDSGLPSITTDDQASSVAFCICSTVGGYILDRFVDDKTWNHETKNGYSSGTITINGSYHHTETQTILMEYTLQLLEMQAFPGLFMNNRAQAAVILVATGQ